jgi:AraC family transcriptional regulator
MPSTKMKQTSEVQLEAPRFENGKAMLIAGFREHFTSQTMNNLPGLWQRFAPHIGNVPGQVGHVAYGLCFNALSPEGIDYLAGVEVSDFSGLSKEFARVTIPAQRYAVFPHREHVSKLRQTLEAVEKWIPNSGLAVAPAVAGAPDFFERYGEHFHPQTGMGDIEVWLPIKS